MIWQTCVATKAFTFGELKKDIKQGAIIEVSPDETLVRIDGVVTTTRTIGPILKRGWLSRYPSAPPPEEVVPTAPDPNAPPTPLPKSATEIIGDFDFDFDS